MKRYLSALAVAALVFGVVLGSAAALDVNGGSVQVGSDGVKCDRNGVTVASYRVEASNADRPQSHGVRITGIHPRCEGADLFAKVLGDGGDQLGYGSTSINGNQATVTYRNGTVTAKDIERVQITIDG